MSERIKAFLIHLAISLVVLAALLYLVIFHWYPPPFFTKDGGWQGLQLITGVDLVLGPLLTLAVYNRSKGERRLKMDLIVIAVVQICALSAGAWIVHDQKTRLVVFANNRFVSLSQVQVNESGVTPAVFKSLQTQKPAMAYVDIESSKDGAGNAVFGNLQGKLLFKQGELYKPLTRENRLKIVDKGFDLARVAKAVPHTAEIIADFLQHHSSSADRLSTLPLYCRYGELALVMDRESGEIVDTIQISHSELIASLAVSGS